jgi:hypothetical protein
VKFTVWLIVMALSISLAAAQGNFYKGADGAWKPLQSTTAGSITKFSLSPESIGGGSTLVVVNKPAWMVLDDTTPPAVVKVLLDGQERGLTDLDLGQVTTAPGEIALAVKDDKNPLDISDVRVCVNGMPLPAGQVTVTKLTPDSKYVRVAAKLGALPQARYTVTAQLSDLAPERNTVTVALKFSTAPLLTNGSFEDVDREGKPVAWAPGAWSSDEATKYEAGVLAGGSEGKRAFRFLGVAGSLNMVVSQQLPPLKPGVPYVVSGQYKSEGGGGVSVITTADGKQAEYLTQSLPAAKDWTPFSYEFQLKPHESLLIVPRTGSKGETWFDDLKLVAK